MSILSALAALLSGCSSQSKPIAAQPDHPGTSAPLSYPILVLGMDVPNITVFESEEKFTTTTKSSSLFYAELKVIDSTGALYDFKRDTPVGRVPGAMSDMMGLQPFRVFIELKFVKRLDVGNARDMVLGVVRNPRNQLSQPPYLTSSEKAVLSYKTLPELIAGCSNTNAWY